MLWTAYCVALLSGGMESVASDRTSVAEAFAVRGTASYAISANFAVWSYHAGHDARAIAERCERWRTALVQHWAGEDGSTWNPKCTLVAHASSQSYLAAVGWGASQTFGSSSIAFDGSRRVSKRRIDIRGDSSHGLASVPHELTHVVLADLLGGRQPPRWADEGMALLADSGEKQRLHARDLYQGLTARRAFRVVDLVAIESYPEPARIPAFYGQSASLTAFLASRDKPARFVEFLQLALDEGYDAALQRVYGIANLGELERDWYAGGAYAGEGYHAVREALEAFATAGAE